MKFQRVQLQLLLRLQQAQNEESGYSLAVTIISIILLGALLLSAALVSKVDTSSTIASTESNSGFYAAEAGLNLRASDIRSEFIGFQRPSGISPTSWEDCIDASTTNNGTEDFACDTSLIINEQQIASFIVDQTGSEPESITVSDGIYAGLNAQEYRYDVISTALEEEGNDNVPTAILGMRFKSRLVPLFQFAIFYENDIEFSIPPDMTMNGRIHSNNNIFVNSGNSTLRLNSILTMAGQLYRGNKTSISGLQCAGTVTIPTEGGTAQNLNCNGGVITPYTEATTTPSNISTWGNTINIGVEALTVPTLNEFDPVAGARYWDNADLRVVLKLDSSENPTGIEIQNADGTVNSSATNDLLNNCPVTEQDLDANLTATDTVLPLDSASGFSNGDVITIGTDLDSNVISNVDSGASTITTKRQLGHAYQGTPWTDGTKVRKAVVSTSDTFYNYREKHISPGGGDGGVGQEIRMLDVDIRALLNCAHAENLMGKTIDDDSQGGLVWFFTVDGPNSNLDLTGSSSLVGNTYGIRLYNGKHLVSSISGAPEIEGLTVVSDQAVYIRGDYNKDEDDTSTSGITERWRPAAVIADTINVLSNAWSMDDSNGRTYSGDLPTTTTSYFNRDPVETTVNAAFLTGTEIGGGSNGVSGTTPATGEEGGVNNYPRFHEDWSTSVGSGTTQECDSIYATKPTRVCFNYRGSFVSLGEPRRVNSDFCGSFNSGTCNIYSPPIRNWDYDGGNDRFDNAANLPPMTPRAVFLTQELFEREFTYRSDSSNGVPVALHSSALPAAIMNRNLQRLFSSQFAF